MDKRYRLKPLYKETIPKLERIQAIMGVGEKHVKIIDRLVSQELQRVIAIQKMSVKENIDEIK